jgi:TctA family transporter
MGLFGVAEVIASINTPAYGLMQRSVSLRSMLPTRDDVRRSIMPALRGTGVGSLFGALPATGPTLSAFMSYMVEKRVSRTPEQFGKGAIEGVAGPEAANNAAAQTSFIPTLALGIPGSATMAIMLGAMMIHGIAPGPRLMIDHAPVFWGLVASFWIGNVLLLILNIPLIGLWVSILRIPSRLLHPIIICLICIGVYSINMSTFDVWMVLIFGVLGYGMRLLAFEPAPLLIGFILGPMIEENFRRAMLLAEGDFFTLAERPITGSLLFLTLVGLVAMIWYAVSGRSRAIQLAED